MFLLDQKEYAILKPPLFTIANIWKLPSPVLEIWVKS